MKQPTCSIDNLIDRVVMSELDRANAKMQVHRAEIIADALQACASGVGKLLKPLKQLKIRSALQH